MIDALISGKLIKDTVLKTGQSGNAYTNFLLSVHVGEPQPIVVSGIAFGVLTSAFTGTFVVPVIFFDLTSPPLNSG